MKVQQLPCIRTEQTSELRLQVAIKSVQQQVTRVVVQIGQWLRSHDVVEDAIEELELVLAEALNNVVEHAYLYAEDGEIGILVRLRADQLRATITDTGQMFDGPPPLIDLDVENMGIEDLPEGGFGWNLIRTLTDNVEFEHKDRQNCLTLTRNLCVDSAA